MDILNFDFLKDGVVVLEVFIQRVFTIYIGIQPISYMFDTFKGRKFHNVNVCL